MFLSFTVFSAIIALVSSQTSTVMTSTAASSREADTWKNLATMPIRALQELTRVCIVVSRRDYTLDTSRRYTYISYPSSYRTTLTQAINVVSKAVNKADMSISSVSMAMSQVTNQLKQIMSLLNEASVEEQQMLLPTFLQGITKTANNAASTLGEVFTEFTKAVDFFEELLRGVQPTPPPSTTSPPSGQTSTQTNKSPLEINHGAVVGAILDYFKSLTTEWSSAQYDAQTLTISTGVAEQHIDDKNVFLWGFKDLENAVDLFSTLVNVYNQLSKKLITPLLSGMDNFLMLESDEQRIAQIQKVDQIADKAVSQIGDVFIQIVAAYNDRAKTRETYYTNLIIGSSS